MKKSVNPSLFTSPAAAHQNGPMLSRPTSLATSRKVPSRMLLNSLGGLAVGSRKRSTSRLLSKSVGMIADDDENEFGAAIFAASVMLVNVPSPLFRRRIFVGPAMKRSRSPSWSKSTKATESKAILPAAVVRCPPLSCDQRNGHFRRCDKAQNGFRQSERQTSRACHHCHNRPPPRQSRTHSP